jgi:hypothetical protein
MVLKVILSTRHNINLENITIYSTKIISFYLSKFCSSQPKFVECASYCCVFVADA